MKSRLAPPLLAAALAAAACSSPPPPPVEDPSNNGSAPTTKRVVPTIESEVGALDQKQVAAVFQGAGESLKDCYTRGVGRVAFLAGEIRLAVRVAEDGSAKHTFVKESTLGDRTTEACMLGVLKRLTWPKPQGGKEGNADTTFTFDPGDDERPPVEWTEARLGDAYNKGKAGLARCRANAGAGPMKATLYVDTEGKAMAVGVSGTDAKSEEAASCVVDLLMGLSYPSPGSWAAKVTISIE